jgi:hypothetical protein
MKIRHIPMFVASILMLGALAVGAQDDGLTASWTPPTEGTPVEYYVFKMMAGGDTVMTETTPDTFLVIDYPIEYGVAYTAVVMGVDAKGRRGPWSEESDPYIDAGPPGQCGPAVWSFQ